MACLTTCHPAADTVVISVHFLAEQLQNTLPLTYMSLNKNNIYCGLPRSSKPSDTCTYDWVEHTVLCKSNANTCRRNSTKFLDFRRILDRNETSTTFLRIFEACIVLNGSNFRQHIPWWHSCDSKFQAKIRSMRRIFGAIIHCNCSFFQKDLAEFVVRYCSM